MIIGQEDRAYGTCNITCEGTKRTLIGGSTHIDSSAAHRRRLASRLSPRPAICATTPAVFWSGRACLTGRARVGTVVLQAQTGG